MTIHYYTGRVASVDFKAHLPKACSPGSESLTNSLLQFEFTEFIIVLGGALQSNQNDNNSQKLQWVVWKD